MIPQLEKYKKMNKDQIAQINTFAIGKLIDTPLLDKYAEIGQGQYCFIPCPGFIGTIFVNTLSNILSTMANKCRLKIQMLNGAKILEVPGGYTIEKDVISVREIKFGQHRDIILKIKPPKKANLPLMSVQFEYFDIQTGKMKVGEVKNQVLLDFNDPLVDAELCRVHFVDEVRKAVEVMGKKEKEKAQEFIAGLEKLIDSKLEGLSEGVKQWEGKDNQEFVQGRYKRAIEFVTNILKDVTGEVTLAIRKEESFEHWGRHFLPSLCHCHPKQMCNNFCDPGIQKYGGALFNEIKDKAELTFIKLPAPKPTRKKQDPSYSSFLQTQQNQSKSQNKAVPIDNQRKQEARPLQRWRWLF